MEYRTSHWISGCDQGLARLNSTIKWVMITALWPPIALVDGLTPA